MFFFPLLLSGALALGGGSGAPALEDKSEGGSVLVIIDGIFHEIKRKDLKESIQEIKRKGLKEQWSSLPISNGYIEARVSSPHSLKEYLVKEDEQKVEQNIADDVAEVKNTDEDDVLEFLADIIRKKAADIARKKAAAEAREKAADIDREKAAAEAREKAADIAREKAADIAREKAADIARKKAAAKARARAVSKALKALEKAEKHGRR